jgi:serine-type D-Ala-D-Ala carboxypeptidase/endopeptidase (penicillin-binding protein 4)
MNAPAIRGLAALLAVTGGVIGCAGRARVAAPTEGHRPEPVAPIMMPVAQVAAPPKAREIVRHLADSAIGAPMWRNARWGVLIVDPASGDTLFAHDADRLFMPASNQKLLTGAVALQVLGPDYRWRTPVLLRGVQRGRVFRGDLVVLGRGDPTVSDTLRGGSAHSAFNPVAAALTARGITRITGDIVAEGDAFVGPTSGFGWEVDDLDTPSGAAVDELIFNEGLLRLMVRAGSRVGVPVTVTRTPTTRYPPLAIDARTRAATDTGARIDAAYDSIAGVLRITGTLAIGDSARISTAYRHPSDAYRAALREHLTTHGIRVAGVPTPVARTPKAGTRTVSRATDTLVVLESPPLREVLPRMQKPSQNQIAELLFRTSGLVATGSGTADSARAVAVRTLAPWGVTPDHLAYRDGSGLSRHDYVSPRAIVQVLDAMHRSPWAALYRQSLPLAGVDGTIANRMRNTPAAGNANAKTGTVDKARSLSGYVTTADGRVLLFAMLANNFTVPTREVERVQDLLVSTLAGLRGPW